MSQEEPRRPRLVAIVGAGPVGCLSALAFAKSGWSVRVYEGRPDMRLAPCSAPQRSVNLAISSRGLAALSSVDSAITQRVLEQVIPMKGRMIHAISGTIESQLYDPNSQSINSIDRRIFNECLLEEVLACPAIQIYFAHKLLTADFDERSITLYSDDKRAQVTVPFDLCIGADGSYSNVRRQMMRVLRMDYQQEYISHEYLELKIPAGTDATGDSEFLLDQNHLHIWPRHSFMLIALPNKDKTFTSTLFAPHAELERLESRASAATWFNLHFPDVVNLIGEEVLLNDLQNNPRSPMMSLKAFPYHYRDRCIILGDAAHSMVPFYGQGLNCGFEDVRVLMRILRNEGVSPVQGKEQLFDASLARALQMYTEMRHEDLVAISNMAMDNYLEMRHGVTTSKYNFQRAIDHLLSRLSGSYKSLSELETYLEREPTGFVPQAPRGWLSQYTMVTFRPEISYSAVQRKAEWQSAVVSGVAWVSLAAVGVWTCLAGFRVAVRGRRTL